MRAADLAEMARRNAGDVMSRIGPATPQPHAVTLFAIAHSWEELARMLDVQAAEESGDDAS